MAPTLPQPPLGTPYINPATGQVNLAWQNYLLALQTALEIHVAPIDAQYWVSTLNSELTNERNIGALSTGYLKITTTIGIATPSSTATIPANDISSGQALSKTDDTNVTLTLGGTPTTALLKATSLTLGWTGLLGLARGGTAANLSATGGTSQVLKQTSSGAAVTVGQLATTDLSDVATSTWTPVLTFDTPGDLSVAYSAQFGGYTKIGKLVRVNYRIVTTTFTHTTASGNFKITGLPFTSQNTTSDMHVGAVIHSNITFDAGHTELASRITNNATEILFLESGSAASAIILTTANALSGTQKTLIGTLVYESAT